MLRWPFALVLTSVLAMAGCSSGRSPDPPNAFVSSPSLRQSSDANFAYTHELTIVLPSDGVKSHFQAAQDRCLDDAGLRCKVVRSSISDVDQDGQRVVAYLRVRLPHDAVAAYRSYLTSPMAGETSDSVTIRDQTTQAEDLARPIDDVARKLAQLEDYRTRLTQLAAKTDTRVEDLIRIAHELSQVQAQIDESAAKRRGLDERIDTEIVSVTLRSDPRGASVLAPVRDVWASSGRILGESAGSALRFALASLPWLPIAAVGIVLVRMLWRLRRRRRARPPAITMERS